MSTTTIHPFFSRHHGGRTLATSLRCVSGPTIWPLADRPMPRSEKIVYGGGMNSLTVPSTPAPAASLYSGVARRMESGSGVCARATRPGRIGRFISALGAVFTLRAHDSGRPHLS